MSEFTRPLEELGEEAKEYVDLRVDDLKLKTVKALSVTLSKLVYYILLLMVVSVVILSVAIGGVVLIGELIGSYAGGAFIVAGFFLLVALVVFLLRNKLFKNTFIPLFAKLFFDDMPGSHEEVQ